MEAFGTNRAATSMIGSIQMGATYCVGPIAANLADRFGCRATAISGSVIAATSIIISGIAPGVETLYVTAGFFTGSVRKSINRIHSDFFSTFQAWVLASYTYRPLFVWQPTSIRRGPLPLALQLLAVDLEPSSLHLSLTYLVTTLGGHGP